MPRQTYLILGTGNAINATLSTDLALRDAVCMMDTSSALYQLKLWRLYRNLDSKTRMRACLPNSDKSEIFNDVSKNYDSDAEL